MYMTVEEVAQKYMNHMFSMAYSITANPHDADDVVQEVLIQYYRKHIDYKDEEHIKAWLLRVTIMVHHRVEEGGCKKADQELLGYDQ